MVKGQAYRQFILLASKCMQNSEFLSRHGGLVKIQVKDCSVFSNYLLAISIYSSGGLKEDALE